MERAARSSSIPSAPLTDQRTPAPSKRPLTSCAHAPSIVPLATWPPSNQSLWMLPVRLLALRAPGVHVGLLAWLGVKIERGRPAQDLPATIPALPSSTASAFSSTKSYPGRVGLGEEAARRCSDVLPIFPCPAPRQLFAPPLPSPHLVHNVFPEKHCGAGETSSAATSTASTYAQRRLSVADHGFTS